MSNLFEEADDLLENEDEFVDTDVETVSSESAQHETDARKRLESLLEEKRLRKELDDFIDY